MRRLYATAPTARPMGRGAGGAYQMAPVRTAPNQSWSISPRLASMVLGTLDAVRRSTGSFRALRTPKGAQGSAKVFAIASSFTALRRSHLVWALTAASGFWAMSARSRATVPYAEWLPNFRDSSTTDLRSMGITTLI